MEDPAATGEVPVVTTETVGIEEVQDGPKLTSANKNGKKAESGSGGGSFFTWFIVLALLGVWTSVAVVYFDLVDYQGVLGKLVAYDTDGDGDFDVEDAKILLDDQPGGGPKAGPKKEPNSAHLKLRQALKLQLSLIHERVEAKKLARMALAEVRRLLEEEEEARALELGRSNMSARVSERVAARLRQEEDRMEQDELEKAVEKMSAEKTQPEEPGAKNESRGEEEVKSLTESVKVEKMGKRAKEKPKKNRAEKS